MSDYRVNGPQDEPRQRVGEAYWPDYLLNLAIVWSGVNNRLPPDKLPNGLVANAVNVRMRNGDIEPRLGLVKPGWLNAVTGSTVTAAGSVLYGGGVFADPATREWLIYAADGGAYACAPNNFRQGINLPTGVKLIGPCAFVQAFNQFFCFRGRNLAPLVIRTWATGFEDVLALYNPATVYQAAIQNIEQAADELSYGPFLALTGLTRVGNVATAVTSQPHGYVTGADVTVRGATPTEYNGRFNVTVVDAYTFTYQFAGSSTATASGTISCSNMKLHWRALGDRLTLAAGALTGSTTVATVTYAGHGLGTGDWVTISGATPAGYNGLVQVQSVPDSSHFTYTVVAGLATPASGTIYVSKSTVTAGHTPDTNPEAWQQIYNVLPNADEGIFINGRLLVPTAYTPGDTGYDSTSSWTKKDYIVALDIFDPVHFTFTNGFRINQGDDSELTNLVKFDNNTVIVTKGKRWGILSNLQSGDYSQITFDLHAGLYGCPAVRSALAIGKNVYFPSAGRGLVSLEQTSQGLLQGVDVPFSADVKAWMDRINWNAVSQQRVAWWNDYLYWAVALDSSATNNAVLVYDFENRQWVSLDQGTQLSVKEFVVATLNGRERLFCLGNDGWINLLEEATAGDQTATGWAEIGTDVTLKGHLFGQPAQKTFPLVELGVAVWNANFTVSVTSGGMRSTRTALSGKTFSRTKYLKPFDATPWNPLNAAQDWGRPNRGDYSVQLLNGMILDGCSTLQWQELFLRPSTKTFRASYALIRIQNTAGRLKIKAVTPAAQNGERRMGVMI